MKKLLILLMGLLLLIMAGCNGKKVHPLESSMVLAKQLTESYFTLYETYGRLEKVLPQKDLVKLYQAAPILNQIKEYLIIYNNLVILWWNSGGAKPGELIKNEKILTSMLDEASKIILSFYTEV